MPGPIKPKEVQSKKDAALPQEVFDVFNQLIIDNWDGHSATVLQDEACERICKALKIKSCQTALDRGLLDVESAYRKAGWKVEFDKPGYNESYDAHFVFSKKRSR